MRLKGRLKDAQRNSDEPSKGDQIAELAKGANIALYGARVLKGIKNGIGVLILTAIFVFFFGFPVFVLYYAIFVVVGGFVMYMIAIKRVASVDINKPTYKKNNLGAGGIGPHEKIVNYISGLYKTGYVGKSWLGKGHIFNPENSVILTNKRLLFVVAPMKGAGRIIGGYEGGVSIDISMMQHLFAKSEIEDALIKLISTKSLNEIFHHDATHQIMLDELGEVRVAKYARAVKFITKAGKKRQYTLSKANREKARKVFKDHIKNKK